MRRVVELEIDASKSLSDTTKALSDLGRQLAEIFEQEYGINIDTSPFDDAIKSFEKFPDRIESEVDIKTDSIDDAGRKSETLKQRLLRVGDGVGDSLKGQFDKVDFKGIGSRAAKTFGTAFKVGVGVAVAGAGALISKSVADAVDLDSGARDIASLGVLDLDEVNAQLDEFAAATGRARSEALQPLYDTISAGEVPIDNISQFLNDANRFAIAGNLEDSTEAVSVLNTALTAFGDTGLTSAQAADVLTTTVQQFRTNLATLAPAFAEVAPAANIAGLSFAETNASLGILSTALGGDTQKAATQLKAALNELSNPTTKVAKEFEELAGVRIDEFLAQGNSVADALDLLGESADDNGGKLTDFFSSTEAKSAVQSLTADADLLRDSIESLSDAQAEGTATQRAFEIQNQSLENQLALAQGSFANLRSEIGAAILPSLTVFLQEVSASLQEIDTEQLTSSLAELAPQIADLVVSFVELAPTILEVVTKVGELALGLTDLVGVGPLAIGGLGVRLLGLNNTVGIVRGSFGLLKTSILGIGTEGGGVFSRLASTLGPGSAFGGAVKTAITSIGKFALAIGPAGLIAAAVIGIGVLIFKNWDTIREFLGNVFNKIKEIAITVWNAIRGAISTAINAIRGAVTKVFGFISAYFRATFNLYRQIASTAWNAIRSVISGVVNAIRSVITSVFNGIRAVISSVSNAIRSIVTGVWNGIKTAITSPIQLAQSIIQGVVNTIKNILSFGGVVGSVTGVFNRVKSAITRPLEAARDAVKRIVDRIKGLVSGVGDAIGKIGGFLNPFAIGGVQRDGIAMYANGGIDRKKVGSGLITRKPSFITSEFGHTEAILPEGASIGRIMNILGNTNILGRLQDEYDRKRLAPALNKISQLQDGASVGRERVTTNSQTITVAPVVRIEDSARRSDGNRRLLASQIAKRTAAEIRDSYRWS